MPANITYKSKTEDATNAPVSPTRGADLGKLQTAVETAAENLREARSQLEQCQAGVELATAEYEAAQTALATAFKRIQAATSVK